MIFRIVNFLVAFLYSFILAFYLPIDGFKDRENYLTYADNSLFFLLRYTENGVSSFFANEPFFLFFNYFLSLFFIPETVLRLFIFIPALLFSYSLLNADRRNFFWLLLVLLLPQVMKNHVMQLRQGFAVGVFVFAWFMVQGKKKWMLFLLTPFIHSSMFVVLTLLVFINILKYLKFSVGIRNLAVFLLGLVASIGLIYLATLLGARQGVRYEDVATNISGMAFLFWSVVLILFLIQKSSFLETHIFALSNLIFYLTLYFFFPLSARIFESALIFVLLAGLALRGKFKLVFLFLFLFYFIYQYYINLQKPFLGMGV